jgi:amino acid transporter
MGVASTSVVGWIIGIGWIVWLLATVGYGVIVIPRYFFAQSFDRYLPSIFAYVNPKFSSPIAANLIDLVITMAFVASASFLYGTIVSIYGIFVAILAYFMIVGLAAAVYAARKEKGGSKMLLMVFVYAIYEYLLYPNIWGGNQLAYGYDLAALVLGIIIYFASKSYHMKRGIDISLTFKEIPPE